MSETKYKVKTTSRFKRDFKLAKRRGLDTGLLEETISVLANVEHCLNGITTMLL